MRSLICQDSYMCAWHAVHQANNAARNFPGIGIAVLAMQCRVPREHLYGLAVLARPDGTTRRVWKTSLAGKYPPSFCRRAAELFADHAPAGAWRRMGEPLISSSWSSKLGKLIGLRPDTIKLVIPSCPRDYKCDLGQGDRV
jgi:hypothetical protein